LAFGNIISPSRKCHSPRCMFSLQLSSYFMEKNVNVNFLPVITMMQFNCFSLNSIGPMVEMLTGPRRFIAVYFSSALAGVCS